MIGQKIANFLVVEELGKGGMGTVYKARDINLKRFVAIKVLHSNLLSDKNNYKRFKNEAEISAQINHPNVATLYNFIEQEDKSYIIMEYVEGFTLEQLLNKKGELTVKESIEIAIQILKGLSAAHALNILHRDLKPANVMISNNGYVKLMDFGIALMENTTRLTTQNKVIGTIDYMAPELFTGDLPSVQSDLYAVGIMLYEMLKGIPLYQANSEASLMYQIIHQKAKLELSGKKKQLEKVISKLVDKQSKKRYNSTQITIDQLIETQLNTDIGANASTVSGGLKAKLRFTDLKTWTDSFFSWISHLNLKKSIILIRSKLSKKNGLAFIPTVSKVSNNQQLKPESIFDHINKKLLLMCLIVCTGVIVIGSAVKADKQDHKYADDKVSSKRVTSTNYSRRSLAQVAPSHITTQKTDSTPPNVNEEEKPVNKQRRFQKDTITKAINRQTVTENIKTSNEPKPKKPIDTDPEEEQSIEDSEDLSSNNKTLQQDEPASKSIKEHKTQNELSGELKEEAESSPVVEKKEVSVLVRTQNLGIVFPSTISSKEFSEGQSFYVKTDHSIKVDEQVIINKGAAVKVLVKQNKTANNGKTKFSISFVEVQTVDGQWLKLRYPEYSDIQKHKVEFKSGTKINKINLLAKRLKITI